MSITDTSVKLAVGICVNKIFKTASIKVTRLRECKLHYRDTKTASYVDDTPNCFATKTLFYVKGNKVDRATATTITVSHEFYTFYSS